MNRRERGLSASVEASIILPVLVLFIGLLITLARVAIAQQHIDSAAGSGARAASLERTVGAATTSAEAAVHSALSSSHTSCASSSTSVSAGAVARVLGDIGEVSVTVICRVSLADVALPFIPGSLAISSTRTSPVDPLRGG